MDKIIIAQENSTGPMTRKYWKITKTTRQFWKGTGRARTDGNNGAKTDFIPNDQNLGP